MNKWERIKILSYGLIICSLLGFLINDFGRNNRPIDWLFQASFIIFGLGYLFIQTRKREDAQTNPKKRKTQSLEFFLIMYILALFLMGIYYYKIEHESLSSILKIFIIVTIVIFIMVMIFRKRGYLRSSLLKENHEITKRIFKK